MKIANRVIEKLTESNISEGFKNNEKDYGKWLISKDGQKLEDDSSDYEFAYEQFGDKDYAKDSKSYYGKFLIAIGKNV